MGRKETNQTNKQHPNACNVFREQKRRCNDQSGLILITHVQIAHESHDLNMDFCSFDNGFQQLCVKQTCVIVILAYFTLFQLCSHCKR